MAHDDKEKKVTGSELEENSSQQEESVENGEKNAASLPTQENVELKEETTKSPEDLPKEKVEEPLAENTTDETESNTEQDEGNENPVPEETPAIDQTEAIEQPISQKEEEATAEEKEEATTAINEVESIKSSLEETENQEKEMAEQNIAEETEEVKLEEVSSKDIDTKEESTEKESKQKAVKVKAVKASTEEGESKEEESEVEESGEDEEYDDHQLDYSNHTKAQLVQVLESEYKDSDMAQVAKILKEIKPAFDELYNDEREKAYQKYIDNGGDKDGFEYKNDDLDERFLKAYNDLRDKKNSFFNNQEKQKDQNLQQKQAILEKLRTIVDSDETVASLKELKDIQDEWKNTGPVAPQHLKSLWANYNALIDRYYDQRSIYFELKELDRKKNLESKFELCEKAEALEKEENIKEAIKELNELHEEFKHIGPVPKEDQEAVWKRFKTASDAIYAKRKEYFEKLKEDLKLNQVAKEALAEKVQVFNDFKSDRISEWNQKTKEILAVQKEWEAIGGLPRDMAKEINKKFWSAFKAFFNHKGQFFKQIEKSRHENLKKKEELVKKADELKESDDFQKTAEILKELQKEWKEIGPVPEKQRNEIYSKFKAACDHFFDRRRANDNQQEKDYVLNLKKKQALCDEIDAMITSKNIDVGRLEEIIEGWSDIGFVPRNEIKNIQHRFVDTVSKAVSLSDLDEEDSQHLKFSAQFNKLKQGPNSNRIIQKKENSLRRQIAKLENDIDLWKNNLSFFADSKTADKLKAEFNEKIDKASRELQILEEQLRAISNL